MAGGKAATGLQGCLVMKEAWAGTGRQTGMDWWRRKEEDWEDDDCNDKATRGLMTGEWD